MSLGTTERAKRLQHAGVSDEPFPHVVLDDLWPPDLLLRVSQEFLDKDVQRWTEYTDPRYEVKLEGGPDVWGPATWEFAELLDEVREPLAEVFGLPPLITRHEGAGLHEIPPGGKLAVHTDFNRSEDGLYRRLNLIVYLNEDWTEADGGHLELWDRERCRNRILPVFNRTVAFASTERSYHGHPVPLPGPRPRRSFATFYFTREPGDDFVAPHTTSWLADEVQATTG